MTPKFKGAAGAWKRTRGMSVGTNDGRDFIVIPFEGPTEDIASFRDEWDPGSTCPVLGYTHLRLKERPTCRDRGPMAYASLRFEGPDEGDGGSSGHSSLTTQERVDRSSYTRESSSESNKSVYSYDASVIEVSYIAESRQTTTSYDSKLTPLPDPTPIKRESGGGPFAASLVLNTDYHVKEWHIITSQGERGDTWEVTETHTKYLEDGALPDS